MRILILASFAASLANFRGKLLRELVARGFEVHAAAPELRPGMPLAGQLAGLGVVAHDLTIARSGTNPAGEIALLLRMHRLMRRLRPDVVMGYTIKPVIWGMIAASLAGVPHRVALITGLGHAFGDGGTMHRRRLQGLAERLYRTALRRAHVTIFQNNDDLALFSAKRILGPSAVARVVDGSGVDLDYLKRAPLPQAPMRFVLIARMVGAKGIREFADAARLVRERHEDARFDLVGGLDVNPDRVTKAELQRWQTAGVLTWHGHVDDVRPFLQAAHVCVLPSHYREGVPRSLLEALAVGRALITTDAPGCRETVEPGLNGLLVPPRDAAALASAMIEMIALSPDRLSAMAQASFAIAEHRFDVRRVNADMLEALDPWHRSVAAPVSRVSAEDMASGSFNR